MMRCRRCNGVVAVLGIACFCGEIAMAEVERFYVNPDQPHTHDERKAPPELPRLIVQASSDVHLHRQVFVLMEVRPAFYCAVDNRSALACYPAFHLKAHCRAGIAVAAPRLTACGPHRRVIFAPAAPKVAASSDEVALVWCLVLKAVLPWPVPSSSKRSANPSLAE